MSTAIDKIHEFDRFGSVLGLERMNALLEKLGNPQDNLQVIHVAGTNGKGSVCKYLEEGLRACDYKVGLYTSPFITRFNERIRLDGADISDEDLEIFTERVLTAVAEMLAEGQQSPTEFEVVTAVAFLYFREKQADLVILEVGLGGSGDSTNVVKQPLACAICSIAYDHMDRLGNTLAEIAAEKAGIIKAGVPIVSNVREREAAKVIASRAYEKNSRLYDVSGIPVVISGESPCAQTVSMELYGTDYSDVELSMVGEHQGENLKTALAIIEILRKQRRIKVERSRLYAGLKRAVQPGRFEVIHKEPLVIVDGAHNEAGAAALQKTMEKFFSGKKVLLVTGILADKQVDEILKHFVSITGDIIATEPDNPRKLKKEALEQKLKEMGITPRKAADAEESVALVKSLWQNYDAVLFAGSLYLIGDVRRYFYDERGSEKS